LVAAVGGGHIEILDLLLSSGADINIPSRGLLGRYSVDEEGGLTAIKVATKCGNSDIVNRLLASGATINLEPFDTNVTNNEMNTLQNAGNLAIVNQLLDSGADVNAKPIEWGGRSALQAAAEKGHLGIVNRLLEAGVIINDEPAEMNGFTAFQAAARSGNLDIVNRLMDSGATVNVKLSKQVPRTPLQEAAEYGHLSIVNLLFASGADVNAKPTPVKELTALQAASKSGNLDVVKRLLGAGADVNANPGKRAGNTAPQAAAKSGHLHIINMLLNSGANVNAVPSLYHGSTALENAAIYSGSLAVVNRLLEAGARILSPCNRIKSFSDLMFYVAVEMRHPEVAAGLSEVYAEGNSQEKWRVADSLRAAKWVMRIKILSWWKRFKRMLHKPYISKHRGLFATLQRAYHTQGRLHAKRSSKHQGQVLVAMDGIGWCGFVFQLFIFLRLFCFQLCYISFQFVTDALLKTPSSSPPHLYPHSYAPTTSLLSLPFPSPPYP
jgi:ankyrin repeat protein